MTKEFTTVVKRPLAIDVRVTGGIKSRWEIFFKGPEADSLLLTKAIYDNAIYLWDEEDDTAGNIAGQLFTTIKKLAEEGHTLIKLIEFANKFSAQIQEKVDMKREQEEINEMKAKRKYN